MRGKRRAGAHAHRRQSIWLALLTALLMVFGLALTAAPAGAGVEQPIDVPGQCDPGYTKVVDDYEGGLSWIADADYSSVVLVGGPKDPEQNKDPQGRNAVFDDVKTGDVISRTDHDISHICAIPAPDDKEPVAVKLTLTSMCQLGKDHVWRVQNDTSYSVPFEVALGAGSGATAEPGWTYFLGSQETTKIVWGGEGTGFVVGETVKAANREVCAYEVELVKDWDGKDAPGDGPYVTLTVDKDDAVGVEVIHEGGTVKVLPGGSYVVTEDVPEGWEAKSGLGEFSVPVWPGPEAFFGTYDPRFGGAEKFITHTVFNQEEKKEEPSNPPASNPTVQVLANEVVADCFDNQAKDESGSCVTPQAPDDDVVVLGIQVEATTTMAPSTTVDAVTADTLPFTGETSTGLVMMSMLVLLGGAGLLIGSFLEPSVVRRGQHESGPYLTWKNDR